MYIIVWPSAARQLVGSLVLENKMKQPQSNIIETSPVSQVDQSECFAVCFKFVYYVVTVEQPLNMIVEKS